jgi:DNA-3-methyladenine glycosylase
VPDERLPRTALARWSTEVAPALLGARLVSTVAGALVAVRLTEVEAYMGEQDPGSHAFRGRTPRTKVMFGPAGHLYVYFTYGMHWCANIVCGPDGSASAVLVRAGEVVQGLDAARARRPAARRDADLARGPARLASALGIDGTLDGTDLCAPSGLLRLEAPGVPAAAVRTGPRVGVSGAGGSGETFPWRFWLADEPTVSTYRPGQPRGRAPRGDDRVAATSTPSGRARRPERRDER